MKPFFHYPSVLCLLVLSLFSAIAQSKEPYWICNHGKDTNRLMPYMIDVQLREEAGLTVLRGNGATTLLFTKDEFFDGNEYRFLAIRYKTEDRVDSGRLSWTTLEKGEFVYGLSFPIRPGDSFQNFVFPISAKEAPDWKGTITAVRFRFLHTRNSNVTFHLSRLGFFRSQAEAEQFLKGADDTPDFSKECPFYETLQTALVPGRILKEEFSPRDFKIAGRLTRNEIVQLEKDKKFSPAQLVVSLKTKKGARILACSDTNAWGYTRFLVPEMGEFRLIREEQGSRLTDIDGSFREAILFVVSRQLMKSRSSSQFKPNDKLTAPEKTSLLDRLRKEELSTSELEEKLSDSKGVTRGETALLVTELIRNRVGVPGKPDLSRFSPTRRKIHFCTCFNATPTPEILQGLLDAGFDRLIVNIPAMQDRYRESVILWGEKNGVDLILQDFAHRDPVQACAAYYDRASWEGHYIQDEPGIFLYDEVYNTCNKYHQITGKVPYVNLHPFYANRHQLAFGALQMDDIMKYEKTQPRNWKIFETQFAPKGKKHKEIYIDYLSQFCEKFDVKYLCTDIYPLHLAMNSKTKQREKKTYRDYVESISLVAQVAKKYDREFWLHIQTVAFGNGVRTPCEEEFRWQAWSALSFGLDTLSFWTYGPRRGNWPSLIDPAGEKTPVWTAVRNVVHEIRALSDTYTEYENLGAFNWNCTDKTPWLRISDPYRGLKTIQLVRSELPVLIGCFRHRTDQKKTAFTLVNMSDLAKERKGTVRVKLLDPKSKVTAWYRGKPTEVIRGTDDFFSFSLDWGEGIFVTVE